MSFTILYRASVKREMSRLDAIQFQIINPGSNGVARSL
jgi:hypothetical protein